MNEKRGVAVFLMLFFLCSYTSLNQPWDDIAILENRMKVSNLGIEAPAVMCFTGGIISIINEFVLIWAIMNRRTEVMRSVIRNIFISVRFTVLFGGLTIYRAFDTSRNEEDLLRAITNYDARFDANSPIHQLQTDFECCGVTSHLDWIRLGKGCKCELPLKELCRCSLPKSCCLGKKSCLPWKAHFKGCLPEINKFQMETAARILYSVLFIILTQIAIIWVLVIDIIKEEETINSRHETASADH